MRVRESNRKDGQSTTIFSITEEKLSYRYFFSMSDEESRNAYKRMWQDYFRYFYCIRLKNSAKKAI